VENMDNKRFILSSEPDDDVKLRMSMIQDITGGAEINARKLFSSQCRVRMKQTQVLECNKKPKLSGRIDQSVLERIVDIPFISHFTSNLEDVDETNHIYPVNTFYKSSEFQQEYKCALFRYILNNARKELFLPPCITARSANFVMDSDELFEWFNENYELTSSKDDILKMVDVYDLFKSSDFFQEKTKEEKRKLNKKGFIEAIASSVAFKGKYFNDTKKINDFTDGERIIKYKLKE
jgi:phage/plasmid-associated DNA primase